MDPTVLIKERVDMLVSYKKAGTASTLCMPCRMRWRGREIDLTELGLRHPTVAGKRMLHVFHMSDGTTGYRLEHDAEALTWTLVAVMEGQA